MKHIKVKKTIILTSLFFVMLGLFLTLNQTSVYATTTSDTPLPISFDLTVGGTEDSGDVVSSLRILFILTIISLAPSILVMMTSFTRVIVVLHFVRSAIGTQQTPPNQVLVGLALFITLFIMSPIITEVNTEAIQPYSAGEITQEEAIERGLEPIREFMFEQVNDKDLALFIDISGVEEVTDYDSIPTTTLIPAFIISELRAAFIIGFLIYIPFIVIDMIVASTLMSMGMMMLPPVTISMPFKLLLFVLADGWSLVIGELVKTFY
jgi:flagellar biosynthetic protein FliP